MSIRAMLGATLLLVGFSAVSAAPAQAQACKACFGHIENGQYYYDSCINVPFGSINCATAGGNCYTSGACGGKTRANITPDGTVLALSRRLPSPPVATASPFLASIWSPGAADEAVFKRGCKGFVVGRDYTRRRMTQIRHATAEIRL